MVSSNGILYGQDEWVAHWVHERIPGCGNRSKPKAAIGVLSADRTGLIAGLTFFDYEPAFRTVQIGVAADNPQWSTPERLRELFLYPFMQLQCNRIWAIIPAANLQSYRTAFHAGFRREATLTDHFGPGADGLVMRILKKEFIKIYGPIEGGGKHAGN